MVYDELEKHMAEGIFDGLWDGLFLVDGKGRIRSANPSASRMTGRGVDELCSLSIRDVGRADGPGDLLPRVGDAPVEGRIRRSDETEFRARFQVLRLSDGPSPGYAVVVRDLGELTALRQEADRLREQLVAAQRLESIGALAGGIAHDFNNMLGGILGFASFSKNLVRSRGRLFNAISAIETTALRASELTRQLLGTIRGGSYEVRAANLNEITGEVARLLGRTVDRSIAIETHLGSNGPFVAADEGQVQQVLLNVCINARDAMAKGGRLVIRTGVYEMDADFCREHRGARTGRYGFVSVEDEGCGMDADTKKRIFEPFFTTKGPDAGTGLGLAMVWSIVKNHAGYLRVESVPGDGSTFYVYLPLTEAPAAAPLEVRDAEIRRSRDRILVVDDEEVIRDMITQALSEYGYRVTTCASGREALSAFEKDPETFDLALLDRIMPGMDGLQLLVRLREIRPAVPVVMMTGYARDVDLSGPSLSGVVGLVLKPFRVSDLCHEIRNALDGGASTAQPLPAETTND